MNTKTQRAQFFADIQLYQAILADINRLKKAFEKYKTEMLMVNKQQEEYEAQKEKVGFLQKEYANLNAIFQQGLYSQEIQIQRKKIAIYHPKSYGTLSEIHAFTGASNSKCETLFQQFISIDRLSASTADVDKVEQDLKNSLFELLKQKSIPHQKYIQERFLRGEEKSQKAIRNMPKLPIFSGAKMMKILDDDPLSFAGIGLIATTGTFICAAIFLAAGILTNGIGMIVFGAIMLGMGLLAMSVSIINVIGYMVKNHYKNVAENYNANLMKSQKTVTRAIQFEETYHFLFAQGLSKTLQVESHQQTDPLLPTQQKPVFSVKNTLKEKTMPELNAVLDAETIKIDRVF